jgi:hypothetical protein
MECFVNLRYVKLNSMFFVVDIRVVQVENYTNFKCLSFRKIGLYVLLMPIMSVFMLIVSRLLMCSAVYQAPAYNKLLPGICCWAISVPLGFSIFDKFW